MRHITYWICFALVALAAIYSHGLWALWSLGVKVPYIGLMSLATPFAQLTPQMLAHHLPRTLLVAIDLVVLLFVVRRLWLLIFKRQGVPDSYAGIAKVLGYVGAASFVLFAFGMLLTIALRAGSGVPAAMLLFPALLCVPWAFALAEATSFRKAGEREA